MLTHPCQPFLGAAVPSGSSVLGTGDISPSSIGTGAQCPGSACAARHDWAGKALPESILFAGCWGKLASPALCPSLGALQQLDPTAQDVWGWSCTGEHNPTLSWKPI